MGIKDTLFNDRTLRASQTVTPSRDASLATNDLGNTVMLGNKPLQLSNESGSILKVLMENGFQTKIQEGIKKGHQFSILHVPPSLDFTLVDTWNEETVDEEGKKIMRPRKNYQFFRMSGKNGGSSAGQTEKSVASSEAPTSLVVEKFPEVPSGAPSVARGEMVVRAEELEQGIQNQEQKKESAPTNIPLNVSKEVPVVAQTTPSGSMTANASVDTPTPSAPLAQVPRKPVVPDGSIARPVVTSLKEKFVAPKTSEKSASYELLRKRFSGSLLGTDTAMNSAKSVVAGASDDGIASAPKNEVAKSVSDRRDTFLKTFYGITGSTDISPEWTMVQNIPCDAFLYPEKYAWGRDSRGNDVIHTLDHYPMASRKLHDRMIAMVDYFRERAIDMAQSTVGQVIDRAIELGII